MIRRIGSDQASFKTLNFKTGLNILLADKSAGATDRQSRNGAGKTSFIELIHFLFGGNADQNNIFRCPALVDWTFDAVVDIDSNEFTISRTGQRSSRIPITGPIERLPIPASPNEADRSYEITNENWKRALGTLWFGITTDPNDDSRFRPTYRSLFAYFARRQESGGFQTPTLQSSKQLLWDQQVAVTYLLGLDWTIPSQFQALRAKEKVVRDLGRAAKSGDLGRYFGRAADLRTRLAVASRHAERLRGQLDDFRVVPEYSTLESEASKITAEINTLGDENFLDRNLLDNLQASLTDENAPVLDDLNKLYAEAGVILPDLLRRRLDDVVHFHQAIIDNRRSHLNGDIIATEQRIEGREQQKDKLDTRRRQIMSVLQSGGALQQYTAMREELGRTEAEVMSLKQLLETAETLEATKAEIKIERNTLSQNLRDDIHERAEIIEEAIVGFEELSEALYERAGSLTIDATPNGPSFEVKIEGQRSKGITNMQIFCFDLTITEICAKRGQFPGFLIHDSHLFDGVDERQVAKALQLGAERAETHGFQYIITMNSDALPTDGFRSDFDVHAHVMDTRLTDATDTGGLFGVRFT